MRRVSGGSNHPASGKPLNDPLEDFIVSWNLNGDAQAKLRQLALHPAALEIVMSEFKAPPGDRHVDGMFIRFASSVQKRLGIPLTGFGAFPSPSPAPPSLSP